MVVKFVGKGDFIRGGRHGCAALRTKGHGGLRGLAASAAVGQVSENN